MTYSLGSIKKHVFVEIEINMEELLVVLGKYFKGQDTVRLRVFN